MMLRLPIPSACLGTMMHLTLDPVAGVKPRDSIRMVLPSLRRVQNPPQLVDRDDVLSPRVNTGRSLRSGCVKISSMDTCLACLSSSRGKSPVLV